MKILVYSSVFYPSIGGIENLSMMLIKGFLAAGHEVKVITEQKQDPINHPLPFEVVESSDLLGQIRLFFWSDLVFMPNVTLKAAWLFFLNPFKKLCIQHNDYHLSVINKGLYFLKMSMIRFANANVSVSKSVAEKLKVDSMVVHNCYDEDVFKLYSDEKRTFDFVFAGRLVAYKGCTLLVRAFAELEGDYTLSIIGEGPEMEQIRLIIQQNQLQERVILQGFLKGEALARVLNRHKIMVLPPVEEEGFGIVALEGLACGCDMIVSDSGGLTEAVNGFAAVFPMRDKKALIKQMKQSISNPDLNAHSGLRSAYLRNHTKQYVAETYLGIFKSMIKH